MRKINLNGSAPKSFLAKGLMIISGLAVALLALVGSFYLLMAAVVIALSTSLFTAFRGKPQPVRVRTNQQPLDGEYRVIRKK